MDSLLNQAEQHIEHLASANRALVDANTKLSRQVKTLENQVKRLGAELADALEELETAKWSDQPLVPDDLWGTKATQDSTNPGATFRRPLVGLQEFTKAVVTSGEE